MNKTFTLNTGAKIPAVVCSLLPGHTTKADVLIHRGLGRGKLHQEVS